ncbi:MAG: tetratricopeptide repeat protein [Flavobacteriales bacterium]|nr:tetratricopeptide repeat protein [Flavobacteriales bacterium]
MQKYRIALIFLAAVIPYFITLWNGYVLDDDLFILKNRYVQQGVTSIPDLLTTNFSHGADGFNDGLYRPLAPITWAIDHSIAGNNAWFGHAMNILIYGTICVLLYLLLGEMMGDRNTQMTMIVALLYAVHPIHTEAVANIKGRDELLAMLFFLMASRAALQYATSSRWTTLLLCVGYFGLAFLSKESAVTAIAVIPLLVFVSKPVSPIRTWRLTFALTLAGVLLFLWRFHVIHSMDRTVDGGIVSLLNNSVVGADGLSGRLASAMWLQCHYIGLLIWPFNLSHDYSYNQIPAVDWGFWPLWLAAPVLATLIGWAVLDMRKRGVGGYAILFYFVTISVVANLFFLIGATLAERFLFMPSLGFCLLVGWLVSRKPNIPAPLRALGVLVLVVWGVQTGMRAQTWKDNMTLFGTDVKHTPESARVQYNYGTELYRVGVQHQGEEVLKYNRDAVEHLSHAVNIYPAYLDAWSNLGISYMMLSEFDSSLACFQKVLGIEAGYRKAWYNTALVYFQTRRYKEAIPWLSRYVADKEDPQALHYLGLSYGYLGDPGSGLPYLMRSLNVQPVNASLLKDIGVAYGYLQDYPRALEYSLKAWALDNTDKNLAMNIGLTYRALGDQANAEKFFRLSGK